jgi:hypothetical protein
MSGSRSRKSHHKKKVASAPKKVAKPAHKPHKRGKAHRVIYPEHEDSDFA